MNLKTFSNYRIAFILDGCPKCEQICEFIERLNSKLPINKRVRVINCTRSQEFSILDNPLISLFESHFSGFPTVFIDGIRIPGSNSVIESKIHLFTLLQESFINKEYNQFTFEKNCEFKKVFGIRRVICK